MEKITGSNSVLLTGLNTLRYKQSSDPEPEFWMHVEGFWWADRTSVQGDGLFGAANRKEPTGGAANGIPSHAFTDSSLTNP